MNPFLLVLVDNRKLSRFECMKVLIQNCVTKLYLCNGKSDHWCANAAKAKNFRGGVVAIDYTIKHKLPDCQLILSFNSNSKYDVVIPLDGKDLKRVKHQK